MLKCFDDSLGADALDRKSLVFGHKLLGHEALSLANLARVIPSLPPQQVMYSRKLLRREDNFEQTFRNRPADTSIEQTIEDIRTTDSYIMVESPEKDPSFADLHADLLGDVENLMKARGVGARATDPKLYLFIASPNSITPFHIDRYSTFLLQFRGNKTVTVFPQWDERVVSAESLEDYVSYFSTQLPWSEARNAFGTAYSFSPGQALHIPFAAGHHVANGSDDVSISMSIIFNTDESMRWRRALQMNHTLRRRLRRFGMQPASVGNNPVRDRVKAGLMRVVTGVRSPA